MTQLNNLNIQQIDILPTPKEVKHDISLSETAKSNIINSRNAIKNIMEGEDNRLLLICGPCSIHDIDAAKEYATHLQKLSEQVKDKFLLAMRVYFEKPRTHIGWKGYINDPDLNNSFNVASGLRRARGLLTWLAELGMPVATEALDPISPQYLADLVSWSAIGARTTESQTHREMASGLSMPVGFKNGTDGSLSIAKNALIAAKSSHNFMGIDSNGKIALLKTKGNNHAHIILRGGKTPNYQSESIQSLEKELISEKIKPQFIVDCSHGNSSKDYRNQPIVFNDIIEQKIAGNNSIFGLMLESHLIAGNQPIHSDKAHLTYGQSITDGCIDWGTTEALIQSAYKRL